VQTAQTRCSLTLRSTSLPWVFRLRSVHRQIDAMLCSGNACKKAGSKAAVADQARTILAAAALFAPRACALRANLA
jgi:hypothetical protein